MATSSSGNLRQNHSDKTVECWLLHGAVGAAADWREITSRLATYHYPSRAVDLWRFLSCESVSMSQFAQRLNAEASGEISRGNQRILIAYSMGARLAMHALIDGGPWDAAVLISGNPGLKTEAEAAQRRELDAQWAAEALSLAWNEFLEKWNAQTILGNSIREEASNLKLKQRRREIARSFIDWSLGAQANLRAELPKIKIPTLWIAGKNDPKFRNFAEEAAGLAPNFFYQLAPQAGHRVPWENPDWLVQQIVKIAQGISG